MGTRSVLAVDRRWTTVAQCGKLDSPIVPTAWNLHVYNEMEKKKPDRSHGMNDGGKLLESWRELAESERPTPPWGDVHKIPWNDPDLSRRLLAVHLDQDTHMASRSLDVVSEHVEWLLTVVGASQGTDRPLRVLDLTCGPGFYCHELARRGHDAVGVDFSPAAIRHAAETAESMGLDCRFREADVTDMDADLVRDIGTVDVASLWFGEFHSFPPEQARAVLNAASAALRPGGLFVLEYQPEDLFLREDVQEWRAVDGTVFDDGPQFWLQEYHWDEETRSEVNDHWILDARTGRLRRYTQCHRAWSDEELVELLADAGLATPVFHPPITGCDERLEFPMIVAELG